nr:anti-sigma regulatory factor [Hydrococcus rivularis]
MILQFDWTNSQQKLYPSRIDSTLVDLRGFEQLRLPIRSAFKVESALQALDLLLQHFDRLYQPWIPKKDWLQCQLALAEGFTNAVRHAHKNLPPETPIEVEIVLSQQSIEMRIWDRGSYFDLDGFLKNVALRNDRLSGHGQGLVILQKIASHLSYTRTNDDRNCLLIVKQFSSQTPISVNDP